MPDNIFDLAQWGGSQEWELMATGINPKAPLDVAKGIKSSAKLISSDFEKRIKVIHEDDELTDIGKKNAITKTAQTSMESLAKLKLELGPGLDEQLSAIAEARVKDKTPEERIEAMLALSEIRKLVTEQTEGDIVKTKIMYLDALEARDFILCDAIESSPRIWAGRPDPDTLEEWKAARLEVELPELSEKVRYLTDAVTDTTKVLDMVSNDVIHDGNLDGADNLKTIAESGNET